MIIEERMRGRPLAKRLAIALRERDMDEVSLSLERDLVVGHDAFLDAYPSLDADSFRTIARNLAEIHEKLTAQPGYVPPRP